MVQGGLLCLMPPLTDLRPAQVTNTLYHIMFIMLYSGWNIQCIFIWTSNTNVYTCSYVALYLLCREVYILINNEASLNFILLMFKIKQ